MNYIPYIIDFETTDKDPLKALPVELAYIRSGTPLAYEILINPGIPIPPETSAIHHITDEDVVGAPGWGDVQGSLIDDIGYACNSGTVILVAHNATYEQGILRNATFSPAVDWICTYKAAMRVWPDAPSFSNEGLRYWLKLGGLGRRYNQGTHSALHDCKVTELLYLELLKHATVEDMIEWQKVPAKLPKIPFGKHRGLTWDKVPTDYLQWSLAQADMDESVKACSKDELMRRNAPLVKQYGRR